MAVSTFTLLTLLLLGSYTKKSSSHSKVKEIFGPIRGKRASGLDDLKTWKDVRKKRKEAMATYIYPVTMSMEGHRLKEVGNFLALHKYYDVDRRYEGEMNRMKYDLHPSMFVKHFPVPRLKKLHPDVVNACEKGVDECIDEIFGMVILTWSSMDRHDGLQMALPVTETAIIYPFPSRVKLFNYRVTASYYMCWYTMREEKQLQYLGGACLDFQSDYEAYGKKKPVDFRSQNTWPFACAMLSFCPDICCGRRFDEPGVSQPNDCWTSKSNPCLDVGDEKCNFPRLENINFEDLMRNRLNYTCNCYQVQKGFEWSSRFGLCVDIDECYDGTYECHAHEYCQNTVGGYKCQCRYGYSWDAATLMCVRHHDVEDMARAIATSAPSSPREETGYTLLDDLKLLYSLFAHSPSLSPSWLSIVCPLACFITSMAC